jgi:hypothetical protein
VEADRNKRKGEVIREMDYLDELSENHPLTSQQRENRDRPKKELEKIRARQRARDRDIKEGDRNTSYFFVVANQRKRKKALSCLIDEGVTLTDNKDMLNHVMSFYKKLFGKESRSNVRLGEDFWDE